MPTRQAPRPRHSERLLNFANLILARASLMRVHRCVGRALAILSETQARGLFPERSRWPAAADTSSHSSSVGHNGNAVVCPAPKRRDTEKQKLYPQTRAVAAAH